MFFDSHAHLFSDPLEKQLDEVLNRASAQGVGSILNICTDPSEVEKTAKLSPSFPRVFCAGATHPHDAEEKGERQFPLFESYAKNGVLKAIGETGLDYHYMHSSKEAQKHYLKKYLKLALECNLPVIIHCREAFNDFFTILDKHYSNGKGVLHCFTGTEKEAEEVLKRGFYLSCSGVITFKKSEALREIVRRTPLEKMLIETDAPYLAPQSRRGKMNEPAFVVETADCIAQIKQVSVDEVALQTAKNTKTLFNLN